MKELNEDFLKWLRKAAETDPYKAAILRTAEDIIKEQDYWTLVPLLERYDTMFKERTGWELPKG